MERQITLHNYHAQKLSNNRDVHIYLPSNYNLNKNKRYPVLYMHDGQGLFEPNPYSLQSWCVHETADRLMLENKIKEIIIVGINSNSNDRLNEFTHSIADNGSVKLNGAPDICCKGELYEDFVINEIKPYIDNTYRTLSDKDNTALIGSSAGGLVTYNMIFRHPEVFGMAGILSPYFLRLDLNTLDEVMFCKMYQEKVSTKIWLDIGEVEANIMVKHVRRMADHLMKLGYRPVKDFAYYCVPDAAHTESDWAERIHVPLLYLFGDIGKEKSAQLQGRSIVGLKGMTVQINPVVEFDSGFIMSDIDGKYRIENPDILEVASDGTIIPKLPGRTIVSYVLGGVETSREYTVIDELPEYVSVSITIRVPQDTPSNANLFVGRICVKKTSENLYGGEFKLPRDIAIQFTITCVDNKGKALRDKDENGNDIVRRLKADKNMQLDYCVQNWS